MKKLSLLALVGLLTVSVSGCGSSTPTEFYQAAEPSAANGWTYVVSFEKKGDDIINFNVDSVNLKTGNPKYKSEAAAAGEYDMGPGSISVDKQYDAIEKYVNEKDGFEGVTFTEKKSDAISGATIKYENVKDLFEKALAAGPVEKGTLTDGIYFGQAPADDKGNIAQAGYYVNHGQLLAVNFDATVPSKLDKDGKPSYKTDLHEAGQYELANPTKGSITEQLDALEAEVLKNQKFDTVDGITSATIKVEGYQAAYAAAKKVN